MGAYWRIGAAGIIANVDWADISRKYRQRNGAAQLVRSSRWRRRRRQEKDVFWLRFFSKSGQIKAQRKQQFDQEMILNTRKMAK